MNASKQATMKSKQPHGKILSVGFLKGGPGTTTLPNAIFRYRKDLGLDSSSLTVLLAVISHGRYSSPDYCQASHSAIAADTGQSKGTVGLCLKKLTTPVDQTVSVRTSYLNRGSFRKTPAAPKGLGLLSLAPEPENWKQVSSRKPTNCYFLGPLADRLNEIMDGVVVKVDEPTTSSGIDTDDNDYSSIPEETPPAKFAQVENAACDEMWGVVDEAKCELGSLDTEPELAISPVTPRIQIPWSEFISNIPPESVIIKWTDADIATFTAAVRTTHGERDLAAAELRRIRRIGLGLPKESKTYVG